MTLQEALWQDPDRVSGAVCFRNTRIPVKTLFDHVKQGRMDDFRADFPDVSEEMIEAVLTASQELVTQSFKKDGTAA